MVIIVDVDDTTANMMPELVKKYNNQYGDWLCITDIHAWDVSQYVDRKCGDKGFWNMLIPEVYDTVQPMDGAAEGIECLRAAGHRIVFATAASKLHPGRKLQWLMDHSFIPDHVHWSDDYGEIKDKSLLNGDVIVDDNPENVRNFSGHAIIFDRPWNHDFNWPNRAMCWNDVVRFVREWQECEEGGQPVAAGTDLIAGIGPQAPTVVAANGARQSALPYAFDLVDPKAMFDLANILATGAEKYGRWNWRGLTVNSNLNHALSHIYAYLAGDEQDDHLGHALCRCMFAWSIANNPDPLGLMEPAK